jgi:hypothetical protein
VRGSYEETFVLRWPAATKAMRDSHNDEEKAAENGAYCIAALLIFDLVGYTLLLQSRKGTGFDYWLGSKQPPYFQARLEVSGINNGDESLINARVKEKLTQTNPSDDLKLPAYVVIVEFGTPQARVVKK